MKLIFDAIGLTNGKFRNSKYPVHVDNREEINSETKKFIWNPFKMTDYPQ